MELLLPKTIDTSRVIKYIFGGENDERTIQAIERLKSQVFAEAAPKVTSLEMAQIPTELIVGSDIKKHLDGCFGALLFAVTLGVGVDRLTRKLGVTDVFDQMVADAISSVLVEQVSEEFESDLKKEYLKKGIFTTSSYAAGYGDYPLSILPLQLRMLDANKKIGISMTSSGFMSPRKSICAIIGLSNSPVSGFRAGCEHCKMRENCKLKKEGKTCVR